MDKWTIKLLKSILKKENTSSDNLHDSFLFTISVMSLEDTIIISYRRLFLVLVYNRTFQMFLIYMILAAVEKVLRKPIVVTPGLVILSILFFHICKMFGE